MRKFLLLPAMLLALSAGAFDEGTNGELVTGSTVPGVGGLFPHFNPNAGSGAGSDPSANLRIIAKANHQYRDGGFVAVDSVRYEYGSGRGSVPDDERINEDDYVLFDLSTKYNFNSSIWGYERSELREQYYTNDNKVSQLIYKNWHVGNNDWKNSERYTYSYDATGKMQKSVQQLWYGQLWTNDINSTLSYDGNNNVVNMQALTYRVSFDYDANNNLVKMEDQVWSQGGWVNSERKTYTYSGTDLTQYILEQWSGSDWVKAKRWTYVYDSKGNITQTTEYTWTGLWLANYQHEYTYDGNNKMLEDIKKLWSTSATAFENVSKEVRVYNFKSLPVSVTTFGWDGQKWAHTSGNTKINFYYEEYVPSSVNNIPIATITELYPVPAIDKLTIKMHWDRPEVFTVSVLDMAGRIVLQQQEPAASEYKGSISVGQLPAGNYAVAVASANVRVVHKIVVAD